MKRTLILASVSMMLMSGVASAQQPSAAQLKFFETSIRPALVKFCYECHSVESGDSRNGLLVDTRMGLLQGGDAGPAIVPGDAEASLLWEAITWDGYEMPPSKKMPASVIANFKKWIDMGAPDPRVREIREFKTKITKKDIEKARREHWAFQPPRSESGATIDSLVAKKLAEEGLHASATADGYTLLRRIYFDLVGLPPTPAEIQRFQAAFKTNPDAAVEAKVNELLERTQYGERWGRHWLDVARYAASSGSRNTPYPHAWRYRNYVIDSFNDDTPYDQFITEQIAGDLLKVKTDEQWRENLIATGFLAIGLKHQDEKNPRKFMSDMVDEQIDTMTQAVLGLTVACARCHDHKYDPLPTDDYYALAGILYSTKTYYGTDRIGQNHRPSELLLLPLQGTESGRASSRQSMDSMKKRIADLDRQRESVRGKEGRSLRNARNRIAGQLASLNADGTAKEFGMGVQEANQMVNANILFGGEVDTPAQEVPRGFVQVLGNLNFTTTSNESSGRLELAKAMTSRTNPLTARVMVNRIWMHLLGKPLVETPSNFGSSGMVPGNQDLLDHLADRFMHLEWSIKEMIREIVMSDTYRRSATYSVANYAVDPDNKFLWRANPRQIDAESLRDAMLAMSGRLNPERPKAFAAAGTKRDSLNSRDSDTHRSVYVPIIRDQVPDSLDLFGFPDPNITSPGRPESIVPTQALYLMNGDFVTAQAQGMASTIEQRFDDTSDQMRMAILWAYGRPATSDELQASAQFFREFQRTGPRPVAANNATSNGARRRNGPRGQGKRPRRGGARGAGGPPVGNQTPLSVFCQTLMASSSFRILD
ncbi:MAG: PSD1 and planctomycete cytochrome C domain-containing protein [Fuerstiella sp.]|nr:PSD1 and planctomycete cytochrome C domain-containing protein [Fuerstiella sp.]